MPENATGHGGPYEGSSKSTGRSNWSSPEERAAQLRAFGRALAGVTEEEIAREASAATTRSRARSASAAGGKTARISDAGAQAGAERSRVFGFSTRLAWIGGGAVALILTAFGWFVLAPRHVEPKVPVATGVAQAPATETGGAQNVPAVGSPPASSSSSQPVAAKDAPAARPAQSPRPVRLSDSDAMKLVISKPPPVYPAVARAAGVTGTVALAAVINRKGTVDSLRVVGGPPLLESAAIDAVKSWRFRPYLVNGVPADFETTISIAFNLRK